MDITLKKAVVIGDLILEAGERIRIISQKSIEEGMEEDTARLVADIVKRGVVSEKDIKLIMGRINQGRVTGDVITPIWDDPPEIDKQQFEKARTWLMNQWKSPTGVERKNNPFGYREQDAIENAEYMTWDGIYSERGNWYTPLYSVYSRNNSFQYYLSGRTINIVR